MAIFVLKIKTFSRASGKRGSRATSGAAYRAGERIRDERTGATYDYSRRRDVLHKEIVLPSKLAGGGAELDWARDRTRLWNAAEHAEARRNARVAREFTVALPHELASGARTALARRFAVEIADRYGSAVDLVVHAPRTDPRNFHAHLLATTREVSAEGLGPKTALELSGTERHRRGLARWTDEIASVRERWAALTNEALRDARVDARVSHRSAQMREGHRSRSPWLPAAAYYIEKRGERSFLADRIREAHRAREAHIATSALTRLRHGAQSVLAALRGRLARGVTARPEQEQTAKAQTSIASPEQTRSAQLSLERYRGSFEAKDAMARASVRSPPEREHTHTAGVIHSSGDPAWRALHARLEHREAYEHDRHTDSEQVRSRDAGVDREQDLSSDYDYGL